MAKATQDVQALLPQLVKLVTEANALQDKLNDKGRPYQTTGMHHFSPVEYTFVDRNGVRMVARMAGSLCVNITGIRPAAEAEARKADTAQEAVAKLSPEAKKALLEQLLAEA